MHIMNQNNIILLLVLLLLLLLRLFIHRTDTSALPLL